MIRRHLRALHIEAMTLIAQKSVDGPAVLPVRTLGALAVPLSDLRREKLATCDEVGAYALTEAGSEALKTGLYEKQPIMMHMPVSAKVTPTTMNAHMTYSREPKEPA